MNISYEILTKRKALGMTQIELANQIQVTNKTISRWEKGTSLPDIYSLKKLSVILGIDINAFFNQMNIEPINDSIVDLSTKNYVISVVISTSLLVLSGMILFLFSLTDMAEQDFDLLLAILGLVAFFSMFVSIVYFIIGTINYRFQTKYIQQQMSFLKTILISFFVWMGLFAVNLFIFFQL